MIKCKKQGPKNNARSLDGRVENAGPQLCNVLLCGLIGSQVSFSLRMASCLSLPAVIKRPGSRTCHIQSVWGGVSRAITWVSICSPHVQDLSRCQLEGLGGAQQQIQPRGRSTSAEGRRQGMTQSNSRRGGRDPYSSQEHWRESCPVECSTIF